MGLFKRFTELLTPPPSKPDSGVHAAVTPKEEDRDAALRLNPEIRRLIGAESIDSETAKEAIASLKHIASVIGLYVAASKIRFFLDSYIHADAQKLWKDRGYVLAADFIFQHVTREIQEIETLGKPIGPNIFRSYCNELVGCLVSGKNVRRSIEVPVLLVENLVERAIMTVEHRETYLRLIEQALESTLAQVMAKFEADQRERIRRRQERKLIGDSSSSSTGIEDPANSIDAGAVEYLQRIKEQIDPFLHGLHQYTGVPLPYAGPVPPDAAVAARNLTFLQGILPLAERCGYRGIAAIVYQRLAIMLEVAQPGREVEYYARAAEDNEIQADREKELYLFKLSKRRYKLAQELFLKAGNTQRAEAVARKLSA